MHIAGKHRHILRNIAIWTFVIVAAVMALSYHFLNYALAPESYSDADAIARTKADCPWTATWVDSVVSSGALHDTIVVNSHAHALHARWITAPEPTDKVAMLLHGYKCQALSMLKIAYMFHHELGYNVVMPDLAAHGRSIGTHIGMGWNDRHDVMQWVNVANAMFGTDSAATRMVVMGISMGAATAMCVSGEEQPPCVKAYIEDCGYTSVWDEFAGEARKQFGLPEFPILYATSALCKLRYGWSFGEASALSMVKACKKPMLFIHGDSDKYVPTAMVKKLYNAKPGIKELWLTPGAGHDKSYMMYHEQYTQLVKRFLAQQGL